MPKVRVLALLDELYLEVCDAFVREADVVARCCERPAAAASQSSTPKPTTNRDRPGCRRVDR